MAPIRKIQVRTQFAPWLSNTLKEEMKQRNQLQDIARETKNPEDWSSFKKLRNKINNKLKSEKINWQKMKLSSCTHNSGQTWKYVKGWLNWTSSGSPTQLFHNGKFVTKPNLLAEIMNSFFIEKINKLKNGLPDIVSDPLSTLRN